METGSFDEYVQEFNSLILSMAGEFRRLIGELAADEGLSHPQAMLLLFLLDNGTVNMGDISRFMGTTHGVATRLMDRLVQKGMVTRERHSGDRRVVLVDLTPRGKGLAGRIMDIHLSEIRRFFAGLTPEARFSLLTMLKDFERQLGQIGSRSKAGTPGC
jgi:DNA-binding MarR family transcriptional regulator